MEPAVGRSLMAGVRAANGSAGVMAAFLAGGWLAAALLKLAIRLTNPSPEALEGVEGAVGPWLKTAWPVVVPGIAVFAAASAWLGAAQIGYMARRVRQGAAGFADFIQSGRQAFMRLLGAWGCSLLILAALFAVQAALSWFFAVLPSVLPMWLASALAVVVAIAWIGGWIWLFVRLSLWYVAVVADGISPREGLVASLRATRGRWWRSAMLCAASVAAGAAASIPLRILGGLAAEGRAVSGLLSFGLSFLGACALVYVGFIAAASGVRFYDDAKAAAASRPNRGAL